MFSLRLRKDFRLTDLTRLTPIPGSLAALVGLTRFHRCLCEIDCKRAAEPFFLMVIMPYLARSVNKKPEIGLKWWEYQAAFSSSKLLTTTSAMKANTSRTNERVRATCKSSSKPM